MKLKTLILTFASILIFSSCLTYQTAWYNPKQSLPTKFSFKEVVPNKSAIQKAFGRYPYDEIIIQGELSEGRWKIDTTSNSRSGYPTKSSEDAFAMIQNYFQDTSESSNSLPYRLDISVIKTEHKINKAYLFISCLTVTTINLLGFPFIGHKTELYIKGEIYDFNDKLIKTYNVSGKASAHSAYYWGYFGGASIRNDGDATLCRVVNSLALKDALEKMRSDIYNDFKSVDQTKTQN